MAGLILTAGAKALASSIGASAFTTSLLTAGAAVAGRVIDNALFGGDSFQSYEGPRLSDSNITSSAEGSPITRIYGRQRTSGQIIWATRFEEEIIVETTQQSGGKGGGGRSTTTTKTTTYNYYANFAVGICEGVVGNLSRVWADGKQIDLTEYTYRFYKGTETQNPDSLIETKEGSANAPAYRGLCYIVFERMPLGKFGNRIPQINVEILRPVNGTDTIESKIVGVNLIPGTTEFGYDPEPVVQQILGGSSGTTVLEERIENVHLLNGESDWDNSIDQITETLPNLGVVCFVVTWFGSDLRCGDCEIKPKVENNTKNTSPYSWTVAGLTRATADVISTVDGVVAFGGTPNDASVIRAIQDLKSRGYEVMMYPFIIMDIENGNTLPNPYSNNASTTGQDVYPWRGKITCSPAPGYVGTVDQTATAATQISTFYGSADAGDFGGSGTTVSYSGPSEWSYSRFILHMAQLASLAGGVDYFCIGSELVNLTTVRSSSSNYPFVSNLITLAGEVSSILPSSEIGYAADWSEYHSHRPTDGSNDVYFHLDLLWSDSNIDFIGIDNYMPLSDWRDGDGHLDRTEDHQSVYSLDYLKSNIEGGEYYEWFYASSSDRTTQTRTNITDGSGKPWVFRNKDIRNWWKNSHYNRPSGVESGTPTRWTAESKPVFFTELGCPAIDKGSNQPNVFYDPKSSESSFPYHSSGARDDVIQRKFIQAHLEYWADNNETSSVYSDDMVNQSTICIWAWDARPWPTFPLDGNAWADKSNWSYGHWINTRLGTVYGPDLLAKIATDYGFSSYDFSNAFGTCDGYVIDNIMSVRSAIEPLELMFFFNLVESGDKIKAVSKHETVSRATITEDNIADNGDNTDLVTLTRAQETELPSTINIGYIDAQTDYKSAKVQSKRLTVTSDNVSDNSVPIIIDTPRAQQIVDQMLFDVWATRETVSFSVLPTLLKLEPGDIVTLDVDGFTTAVRITQITDGLFRQIEGIKFNTDALTAAPAKDKDDAVLSDGSISAPIVEIMDLPLLNEEDLEYAAYTAAYATPWPATVPIYRSPTTANYSLKSTLFAPAKIGETLTTLAPGPEGRWDYANTVDVELYFGELSSLDDLNIFEGNNTCAIKNSNGDWEVFQFATATLIGTRQYKLSKLLRSQLGTEDSMIETYATGSRFIVFDLTLSQLDMSRDDLNRNFNYRYGPGNKDISSSLYNTENISLTGKRMKPFSPVSIEYSTDSSNNTTITWIRRSRIGGDNWEYEDDIILGETTEQYEVDILNSSDVVVRTEVVSTPNLIYTNTQKTTDSISGDFDVIVYQISESFGRGTGRRKTINV